MTSYRVNVSGLPEVCLSCPGCSGDALKLAMDELGLESFRVERRSDDGRSWWFQATFKAGAIESPVSGPVTRLASVDRLDD